MKYTKCHVRDYMRTPVVTVHADTTVREVTGIMLRQKTNGVVVIDDHETVVGILSSWDIINHIVPDYLEADTHLASFEAADMFAKRTHEVADDPISGFMTTNVHTVKKDDTLISAVALLSEFRIRQLPVTDDKGKLIGYINRTDIKHAVGDVLEISYS